MNPKLIAGILAVSTALAGDGFAQNQAEALPEYEAGASVILSGTIESIGDEEFVLNYGNDKVNVDLGEWEWADQLGQRLSQGQQVTVSGTVDDDWFERREIEADNIYVTTDYTYYYMVDENPAYAAQQRDRDAEGGTFLSTRGTVTDVAEDQITVESEGTKIQVDTSELAYDPLDEEGVQQIREGDRIYVFGDIDEDFFETRTLSAESLVSLTQAGEAEPGLRRPPLPQTEPGERIEPPGAQGDQQPNPQLN